METKEFKDMNLQEKMTAFYQGFNKTMIVFDAPSEAKTEKVEVLYTGSIPLLGFKPGCGCQKFVLRDGVLSGDWNMSGGKESSFFEVLANDGQPAEIVNADGQIIPNPQKVKITIQLEANVPETAG